MATDVNSQKLQTDTNSDPSFHRLDILGKRIPSPHEGLGDNKMDLLEAIYSLNDHSTVWPIYKMASVSTVFFACVDSQLGVVETVNRC